MEKGDSNKESKTFPDLPVEEFKKELIKFYNKQSNPESNAGNTMKTFFRFMNKNFKSEDKPLILTDQEENPTSLAGELVGLILMADPNFDTFCKNHRIRNEDRMRFSQKRYQDVREVFSSFSRNLPRKT